MTEFGFTVREIHADADADEGFSLPTPGWLVCLPHQCDAWDIAGNAFDGGIPHAEAVQVAAPLRC